MGEGDGEAYGYFEEHVGAFVEALEAFGVVGEFVFGVGG